MQPVETAEAEYEDDPIYRASFRDAVVILIAWFCCLVWSVSYCYINGYLRHEQESADISSLLPEMEQYDRDPRSLEMPFELGIPDWAFWGIAVPWGLCLIFSAWLSFVLMNDPNAPSEPEADSIDGEWAGS